MRATGRSSHSGGGDSEAGRKRRRIGIGGMKKDVARRVEVDDGTLSLPSISSLPSFNASSSSRLTLDDLDCQLCAYTS